MKKFKLLFCIAAVLFTSTAFLAADPLDFNNAVGVFILGNVTADEPNVKGIQYQRWCSDRWGFQTEGFVTYANDSYKECPEYDFCVSGEVLLKLFETPKGYKFASTLYAWGLAGIHGFNNPTMVDSVGNYGEPGYVPSYYKDAGFAANAVLGIGFGFDIMMLNHISIPVQFGFEGEFPNAISAGFCLGTGIRYKF